MRNENLAKNIEKIRLFLGDNKTEFGERLKASGSLVTRWEKGTITPNPKRLKTIAELGSMSVEQLLSNNSKKTVDDITQEIKTSFNDDEIKQIIRNLI